jgi:hypothetical protein
MFRLAKLRHDPGAVGDCFGYDFANGPLAFSDGIDTILDKRSLWNMALSSFAFIAGVVVLDG